MSESIPVDSTPTVEGAIHHIGNNEIQVARHGQVEVLTVRGSQGHQLLEALETIANRCTQDVGLDFRGLNDMTPTILPLLRRLNRRFEEKERFLLIYDPPSRLIDLLTLSGCTDDFNIYDATQGVSKRQQPAAAEQAIAPTQPRSDFDHASNTIVRFTQDLQRTQELESSLDIAGMRAGRMIQKQQPTFDDYAIASAYLPHDKVGGDFFQLLPLDDEHFGVVIGDVSGHGLEAALLMGMTRKVLEIRAHDGDYRNPAATLSQVNTDLFPDLDRFTFVTAFYGILHRETGEFIYGRAGHNYPIHVSNSQACAQPLTGGGIAFGIDDGQMFQGALQNQRAMIAPGDAIVLYTDGLVESAHPHRGQYGLDRLVAFVGQMNPVPSAEQLKEAILAEVQEFLEGTPLNDDLSLICIRRDDS